MDSTEAHKFLSMPLAELVALADNVRAGHGAVKVDLCTIMNAKSGLCAEDCKFCAQSCRYRTGVETYPLKTVDEIIGAALHAREIGAERFGIVTSGNRLSGDELKRIADAVSLIQGRVRIKVCASLGKLGLEELGILKKAGLSRYHHNIETSPSYFPAITTTHTFKDRLDTIRAAQAVGLEVCSGGIIGLGESWADRIEMAMSLRDLGITSVPVNILVPIRGTPLGSGAPVQAADAIRTIALFRIILEGITIKVAAGRESVLKDFQAMAFMAGANGMLIGGYLTIQGRSVEEDRTLAREIEKAWTA
ncbi:MAG: biotin synthase BioB [Candidatus Omnitrophica bacterium]|nr:biotin synthase BioB [Candidatus Omnitrophota bacterium]